jgi:hypothetical protein
MAGRVRFTSRIKQWTDKTEGKLDMAVLEMATDIHRISGVISPKDSRALVNSGRIDRVEKAHYRVTYGGGRVPYARMRHYKNRKTPGSLRYLERAGETVSRNFKRYIRDI